MNRIAILCTLVACATPPKAPTTEVAQLVDGIRRDDYRGDLDGLKRGHDALASHAVDPVVRYWRAFALWRLGMNRMNDPKFDRAAAKRDFQDCAAEFAAIKEPALAADARSSQAGCLIGLAYVADSPDQKKELFAQFEALMSQAIAAAPDNPRVLWMLGGQQMWTPPARGGDPAKAIATFERGLAIAHAAPHADDPLALSWGEPELLMSLAFAYSSFAPIDTARAEDYARKALALQPEWKFVRDNLLPKILAKRTGT